MDLSDSMEGVFVPTQNEPWRAGPRKEGQGWAKTEKSKSDFCKSGPECTKKESGECGFPHLSAGECGSGADCLGRTECSKVHVKAKKCEKGGQCQERSTCSGSHPPLCSKGTACTWGPKCKFSHVKLLCGTCNTRPAEMRVENSVWCRECAGKLKGEKLAAPRQEEKGQSQTTQCPFGKGCKFGSTCRADHTEEEKEFFKTKCKFGKDCKFGLKCRAGHTEEEKQAFSTK